MDYVQWIFSGIGTQIVTGIVALLAGGVIGYRIRDIQIAKQKQIAGNSSNQRQELHIERNYKEAICEKESHQVMNQIQKAGDNSTQVQIGEFDGHNGR